MSDQTPLAIIIGASRGLGLGLVREYLARGWRVVGTVRGQGTDLHSLAEQTGERLRIMQADINRAGDIDALAAQLQDIQADLLFVNAGVSNGPKETIVATSQDEFVRVMVTNAFSPMKVIEGLADRVKQDGTIAVMSSGLGSVANNNAGGWEVYRASKASLNTLMRSYAARTKTSRSLLTIAPGWVRTDMGGPSADLDVETSIRGVVDVVAARKGSPGLAYLNYKGETLPW